MQAEGEAKQIKSKLIDAAGSVKANVKQAADALGGAIDGLTGKTN